MHLLHWLFGAKNTTVYLWPFARNLLCIRPLVSWADGHVAWKWNSSGWCLLWWYILIQPARKDPVSFGHRILDFPGAAQSRHGSGGLINPFSAVRFREMSSSILDMSINEPNLYKTINSHNNCNNILATFYTSLCLIIRWTNHWIYGSSQLVT